MLLGQSRCLREAKISKTGAKMQTLSFEVRTEICPRSNMWEKITNKNRVILICANQALAALRTELLVHQFSPAGRISVLHFDALLDDSYFVPRQRCKISGCECDANDCRTNAAA